MAKLCFYRTVNVACLHMITATFSSNGVRAKALDTEEYKIKALLLCMPFHHLEKSRV